VEDSQLSNAGRSCLKSENTSIGLKKLRNIPEPNNRAKVDSFLKAEPGAAAIGDMTITGLDRIYSKSVEGDLWV
jgi:hypothetical protein